MEILTEFLAKGFMTMLTISMPCVLVAAGIGLIVSILCQVLSKNGRDSEATMVSLAGVMVVLFMLIGKLSELIKVIEGVFGIV